MALAKELKEILVCPKCKGELDFREPEKQVVCPSCRLAFPIVDDIPWMLLEEAQPLRS
ncbi:MAG: Trm112 family protein [Deltaproteobacteria bacterium]|nr:Trm112 family protein [Deltaproteobacteria bacterium]